MLGRKDSTARTAVPQAPEAGNGHHDRAITSGEKGVVHADVRTVDAVVMGHDEGNMVATGNVEIAETGRVAGNIRTDSLVISKGGFFNSNVTKMNEADGQKDRSVLSIDEKRAGHK